MTTRSQLGTALLLLAAGGCGSRELAGSARERQVAAIATSYTSWGRVDDELRWAPTLCRGPFPGKTYMSQSTDEATHGRKLYSVFAKDHARYPDGPHTGQVVVKESWVPERLDAAAPTYDRRSAGGTDAGNDHFHPYAKDPDGVAYRAGARAGLFIMFTVDPPAADTDDGWVYATVTPEGRVSGLGRLDNCMGCHVDAPHHRLFGVNTSIEAPFDPLPRDGG